jgi:phage terminase large subunit-like protein
MSWAVANARAEPKVNAIMITKQACGSATAKEFMSNRSWVVPFVVLS